MEEKFLGADKWVCFLWPSGYLATNVSLWKRNSRTFVAASPFLSVLLRATEMQNGFVESLEPHPLLVAAWKLSEMGLGHTEIKTGAARHEVQGTTKSLHEEMELRVKLRDNQTQGKTGHISRWQLLWFKWVLSQQKTSQQTIWQPVT